MSVGQGAAVSPLSYIGIGRETALGTAGSIASQLLFISSSLKTTKETKILEQIEQSRTYAYEIKTGKVVEGDLEYYYYPESDACNFILQNAFGGTVTSATATGETAGGTAFTHTFEIGNMDQSYTSLTINNRKGDSVNGKVFQYTGLRVNEINFVAELDEALKCEASLIGVDSTVGATDFGSTLPAQSITALSFVSGRLSVEGTFASLTSSSQWHVQSINFGWTNNLKADSASRRIGSDLLQVLPPGMAQFTFSATMRFDTTTAYAAMLANTNYSAQLEFLGDTLSTSIIRRGIKFNMPNIRIMDAGDPEIGGPDELLISEVTFAVLRDASSATGYALQAQVTNTKSSYA